MTSPLTVKAISTVYHSLRCLFRMVIRAIPFIVRLRLIWEMWVQV